MLGSFIPLAASALLLSSDVACGDRDVNRHDALEVASIRVASASHLYRERSSNGMNVSVQENLSAPIFGPGSEVHKLALNALKDTEPLGGTEIQSPDGTAAQPRDPLDPGGAAHDPNATGLETDPIKMYMNQAREVLATSAAAKEGVDKVLENLMHGNNEMRAHNLATAERHLEFEKLQRRAGHYVNPKELPITSHIGTTAEKAAIHETASAPSDAQSHEALAKIPDQGTTPEDAAHEDAPAPSNVGSREAADQETPDLKDEGSPAAAAPADDPGHAQEHSGAGTSGHASS